MQMSWRLGLLLGLTLSAGPQPSAQTLLDPTRPLTPPPPEAERSVVCGLTILQGRSAVDEKMAKAPPAGRFSLQVQTPPVCRDMSRLPALRNLGNLPDRLPTFLGPKR
jgi:hypothetical protein